MQITCDHKLACSWLPASELDHNFFLNLEFSTLSLLVYAFKIQLLKAKLYIGYGQNRSKQHRAQLTSVWLNWNFCLAFVNFFLFWWQKSRQTRNFTSSTKEYAIKYFFHTFMMSLMTLFYKEASELLVINTTGALTTPSPPPPHRFHRSTFLLIKD